MKLTNLNSHIYFSPLINIYILQLLNGWKTLYIYNRTYPFDLKSLFVHNEILKFTIGYSKYEKQKPEYGCPFGQRPPLLNESQMSSSGKLENGAHDYLSFLTKIGMRSIVLRINLLFTL